MTNAVLQLVFDKPNFFCFKLKYEVTWLIFISDHKDETETFS